MILVQQHWFKKYLCLSFHVTCFSQIICKSGDIFIDFIKVYNIRIIKLIYC